MAAFDRFAAPVKSIDCDVMGTLDVATTPPGQITRGDHPAGVVTKADVEALRAVLYAAKTGTPEHVTKEEAEVLFEIAHATSQAQVDPSFDDFRRPSPARSAMSPVPMQPSFSTLA